MKKKKKLVVALFHPDDPHGPCLDIFRDANDLDNFDEFHHFAEIFYDHNPSDRGQIMVAFDPNLRKISLSFLGPLHVDQHQANAHAETIRRIVTSHQ